MKYALALAVALAAAPAVAQDIDHVTCADVVRGSPNVPSAFLQGYVLGLMFDGDISANHENILMDACRRRPNIILIELVSQMKLDRADVMSRTGTRKAP